MFVPFFLALKEAGVPVSLKEFLTLLSALEAGVCEPRVEDFYYLCRAALVKDERHLDRFDQVFARHIEQIEAAAEAQAQVPEEWLRRLAELYLSEEEKAKIQALGGFEALMKALQERLKEQKERHQGGNRWIGTAGTSPFGAYGYNPEGVRIGQEGSRHRRAVKVWDKREFKNLDDESILGGRNVQLALRRLRRFAKEGAATELDLPATIDGTARRGYLDLRLAPERHNAVKVLLFLDVGGSMDDHIQVCAELFQAARSEFKHLEHYYFHNCLYEEVWRDNRRRHERRQALLDVLHTYPSDYKVILVGDAAMSPYEILSVGGSVEHWNQEPGQLWMRRLLDTFPHAVWLNPVAEEAWGAYGSIALMQRVMEGRMFPLTLGGLDAAMRELGH